MYLQLLILSFTFSVTYERLLNIVIYHLSDIQCNFGQIDSEGNPCAANATHCYGGSVRLGYVLRLARKKFQDGLGPPVLVFNAGNTFSTHDYCEGENIRKMIQALNTMKINAMTLGPMDLSFGLDKFAEVTSNLTASVIVSNLHKNTKFFKSKIIRVDNYKIGIIGYVIPYNLEYVIGNVSLDDGIISINREARELRARKVKTIIAVGYSGIQINKMVAYSCPLVDLVIAGGQDAFLWHGVKLNETKESIFSSYPLVVYQESGKRVPIVTVCPFTKYVGKLIIRIHRKSGNITSWKGNPKLLNMNVTSFIDLPEYFNINITKKKDRAIAKNRMIESKVVLQGNGGICGIQECNFGNLLTDILVYNSVDTYGQFWTSSAVAIIPGNIIKYDVPKGKVSPKTINMALVRRFSLIIVELKGKNILKILRDTVTNWGEKNYDRFLQVSGLHIVFDMREQPERRLKSVTIRCSTECPRRIPEYIPLNRSMTYRIIIPKYMKEELAKDKEATTLPQDIFDCLQNYASQYKVIYPAVERRIIIISGSVTLDSHCVILIHLVIVSFIRI